MTQPNAASVVTLEEVRARFLEAEQYLMAARGSLGELDSAVKALTEARGGLRDAGVEIAKLNATVDRAAAAASETVRLVAQGLSEVQNTEPGRLAARVEQLSDDLRGVASRVEEKVGEGQSQTQAAIAALNEAVRTGQRELRDQLSANEKAAKGALVEVQGRGDQLREELKRAVASTVDVQSKLQRSAGQVRMLLGIVTLLALANLVIAYRVLAR